MDWGTPSQWVGSVPDNGGVATFIENTGSPLSPSINNNYTLSAINITSSAPYNLAGTGSITFPASGGTLNFNIGAGVTNSASSIAVPISGGPMTVTGNGVVYLSGSNTFEGGVNISGGSLTVNSDSALGATDLPADGVTLNSGTLGSTSALITSRPIVVNGTSTIQFGGKATLLGAVSGSGNLIKGPASGGGLYFNNSGNTFSGTFYEDYDSGGSTSSGVYIGGTGALPNLAALYTNSSLLINNTSGANSNRLGNNTATYFLFILPLTVGIIVLNNLFDQWLHVGQVMEAAFHKHFMNEALNNGQPHHGPKKRRGDNDWNTVMVTITALVLGISTSITAIQKWQKDQQLRLELEQDKVSSELSFLKAQINPHFFFNTLNNIYALTLM